MKIALITLIAALSNIGVYLAVHSLDIIPHDQNVITFWTILTLTFCFGFSATINEAADKF
jgi:hypothetical protein